MGHERVKAALGNDPWAITEPGLQTIIDIVAGANDDWEAVAAKIGKPLQHTREVTVRDGTAIIPVAGPIFRYANLFTEYSGATSISVLAKDFRTAEEDPEIEKIILVLDSPGGQASGVAEFADQIRASNTEVVAYVDNFAASAGYWIAAAADKVVVNKAAEVGSVGVVFSTRLRKNTGEVHIVSKVSPDKVQAPGSAEWTASLQKRADDLAEIFVTDVAGFRNVTREKVITDFGQGGLLLGQNAVDAGMADEVGTFEGLFVTSTEDSVIMSNTTLTVAELKTDHKYAFDEVFAEGKTAGHAEGVLAGQAQEVARIQSVREQKIPGHEALIETMMFDGKSTGADAAMAIIKAEKVARSTAAEDFKTSAPEAATTPVAPASKAKKDPTDRTSKEQIQHDWDTDAELRAEFDDSFDAYSAFAEAEAAGAVRIMGGKK